MHPSSPMRRPHFPPLQERIAAGKDLYRLLLGRNQSELARLNLERAAGRAARRQGQVGPRHTHPRVPPLEGHTHPPAPPCCADFRRALSSFAAVQAQLHQAAGELWAAVALGPAAQ